MSATAAVHSVLYVGKVVHRRLKPRRHSLRYRMFWTLIDLDELPALAARLRLFSHNRFNLFSFNDTDHGDGGPLSLRKQIERTLAASGIDLDGGRIALLCMPRILGYVFNPISVYFCHRNDGALAALLYEVRNTFGEKHSYLIPVLGSSSIVRQACDKILYVSPFMGMDMRYDFRVQPPGSSISVAVTGSDAEGAMIVATLAGKRAPLTDAALARVFVTHPLLTFKVIGAIHWQALKLWLKGIRLTRKPAPPAAAISFTPAEVRTP